MRFVLSVGLPLGLLFTASLAAVPAARADSCWTHNGSLMRLQASGPWRWFSYEVPRPVLRQAGVTAGTLLFEGRKTGNWYEGTARVFSRHCPGTPLVYAVEGPVRADQLHVTLRGSRQVYEGCRPTGRWVSDVLVFEYSHRC